MALVQGIYDLGKPGREQSLYTNRSADAALMQENFMSLISQPRNAITFLTLDAQGWQSEALANIYALQLLCFVL